MSKLDARNRRRARDAARATAAGIAFVAGLALAPAAADASAGRPLAKLTATERRALFSQRAVVTRRFETADGAMALVAYVLIDAPATDVVRALCDPAAYPKILPMNRSARPVRAEGDDLWLALEHGTDLVHASFVVRVRAPAPSLAAAGDLVVRFWLDAAFDHDIDRTWGYFRVSRLDDRRSLLVHAAAVDLGSPVWKLLFTGLVARHARRTPALVRDYVEARRAAAAPYAPLAPDPNE